MPPSVRRQIRRSSPDVATPPRAMRRKPIEGPTERMLHCDLVWLDLGAHAAHCDVAPAVDHEPRVARQAMSDRVGA